jgi:hypothetical protein
MPNWLTSVLVLYQDPAELETCRVIIIRWNLSYQ